MLKNLKRLFVSVLVSIFSLACVVNLATYASGTWIHWNPHSEYFARSFPDLPKGAKYYEDTGHDYDRLDKEYSRYEKYYNLFDVPFISPQENFSQQKSECMDKLISENLYRLCLKLKDRGIQVTSSNPWHQYKFVCTNLFNLIQTEEDYFKIKNTLNGITVKLFDVNLLKTKLDLYQRATIMTVFDELQVLDYQKFDYLNFFSKQPSLNLFDAIFVYSYICNIVGPEYEYKVSIEDILKAYNISPETFVPIC